MATKLLAVKVGDLKKKSASANSNHSQGLMASSFAALWPTDPKFSASKDLILFSTVSKAQEASRILKMGFALSKWPHLLHKMGFVDSLTHTTVENKILKIFV